MPVTQQNLILCEPEFLGNAELPSLRLHSSSSFRGAVTLKALLFRCVRFGCPLTPPKHYVTRKLNNKYSGKIIKWYAVFGAAGR